MLENVDDLRAMAADGLAGARGENREKQVGGSGGSLEPPEHLILNTMAPRQLIHPEA
jgi:hypothetical protein